MDFLAASNSNKNKPPTTDATLNSLHQADGKYRALHDEYTFLKDQHEKLKQHMSTLSETVKVLGDQSSHTTKVAQQAQDSKLDLMTKHSKLQAQLQMEQTYKLDLSAKHNKLQEQYKALKDTVEALSRNCESADEKLLLQKQLHENKIRTIEATHNTLKDRCTSMAVSAEQHRLANLQLEVRNKSMTKDIESLAALHSTKEKEAQTLQTNLSKLQSKIDTHKEQIKLVQSEFTNKLQARDSEIASLKSKIESHVIEARRLQSKIQAAEGLLKAHPLDPCQSAKTKSILASSAEILELAHANGGADSMRQCLGQVAEVLKDLNGQLGSQRRLSKAWLDQVAAI